MSTKLVLVDMNEQVRHCSLAAVSKLGSAWIKHEYYISTRLKPTKQAEC